jgi:twitching motility protein PilU
MNDKQAAEFELTKEANFAISPGGIGRFRVSAFVQQGPVGMVLRTITRDIPTSKTSACRRCSRTWP